MAIFDNEDESKVLLKDLRCKIDIIQIYVLYKSMTLDIQIGSTK
jgi:hypothetical protein